jgi:hypothetical protein
LPSAVLASGRGPGTPLNQFSRLSILLTLSVSRYNAVQEVNSRKGSAPLPVIICGTKIDLVKDRAVKPEDVIFAHTKNLPYLEISSKAGHNVETLLLGICRSLLGCVFRGGRTKIHHILTAYRKGTQLTDKPELESPTATVNPEEAAAAMKEYALAGKK